MKRLMMATAAILLVTSAAGTVSAQPRHERDRHDRYDNHRGNNHHNWRRGGRIERSDWNRGHRVNYRQRHLRAPPRGYEWREVDGNLVLAAVATGIIASIILSH